MTLLHKSLAAAALLAAASFSHAAAVINMIYNGTDVVASGSGSFNTAGLTDIGFTLFEAPRVDPSFVFGSVLTIGGGNGVYTEQSIFEGISGPSSFGLPGALGGWADSATGDSWGMIAGLQLNLPLGYVSGTQLNSTAIFRGLSLDSMGLIEGTYVWTWGSGANADSLTLNISTANVVPEPGSLALLAAAGVAAGCARRRAQVRAA